MCGRDCVGGGGVVQHRSRGGPLMSRLTAAPPTPFGNLRSLRRFSVPEYHRMIQAGILTDEDKVELLEGYVVLKMPRNPPHDGTIQMVAKRLGRLIPAGW